jgi:hypothetical protein
MREIDDGDGKIEARSLSAVSVENKIHLRNVLQHALQAFIGLHRRTYPLSSSQMKQDATSQLRHTSLSQYELWAERQLSPRFTAHSARTGRATQAGRVG